MIRSIAHSLRRIADALSHHTAPEISPVQSYTRRQAARLLNVSAWTIDRARKEGLLAEAERIGQRDVRITGASLLRFHRQRAATVRAAVQKL